MHKHSVLAALAVLGLSAFVLAQEGEPAPAARGGSERQTGEARPGAGGQTRGGQRANGQRANGQRGPGERAAGQRGSEAGGDLPGRAGRFAQRPGGGAGGGLMAALDLDGDGALSGAEIDLAVVSLRKLDKNGDGRVDAGEIGGPSAGADGGMGAGAAGRRGPGARAGAGDAADLIRDTNGDGKITFTDLPEPLSNRFAKFDRNGNGELDPDERQAAMKKLQEKTGGDAGRKRPGDGSAAGGKRGGGASDGEPVEPKRPAPKDGPKDKASASGRG